MMFLVLAACGFLLFTAFPAHAAAGVLEGYTTHWIGFAALILFILAYGLVIFEETIHLRKSKPVIAVAGLIWLLVAIAFAREGKSDDVAGVLRHNLLEYAEMALFLLSAMTYINTMDERGVFQALRAKLVSMGLSYRQLFWVTGLIAFFMSPVADNMTTALVLGAVVVAVGAGNPVFVSVACINVVVAANAGGAFSPFGDITTLMVWQKGMLGFFEFFDIFIPSVVSWIIPAFCMLLSIKGAGRPSCIEGDVKVRRGGYIVCMLFAVTISVTVALHHFLHLPPFLGMMTGLGFLMGYSFFIRTDELKNWTETPVPPQGYKPASKPFDVFVSVKRVEWDTLLFFYGIILCVGGLGALGYLSGLSAYLYGDLGATTANIMIGLLSAVIDNIPVMFAVLSMEPDMNHAQWLLVTLTAGIGGSLLSIGSAAGVALMGQARGTYTFFSHLKWTWAIALGYAAAIAVHILMNGQ